MADSGNKRHSAKNSNDEEEGETYDKGSNVPPPPSYDEAIQHALDSSSPKKEDFKAKPAPVVNIDDELELEDNEQEDGARVERGGSAGSISGNVDGACGGHSDDDDGVERQSNPLVENRNTQNDGDDDEGTSTSAREEELESKRRKDIAILRREESLAGVSGEENVDEIEMMEVNRDLAAAASLDVDTIQIDTGRYSPKHSNYGDDRSAEDEADSEANRPRRRRRRASYDVGIGIPIVRELVNFVVNLIIRTYDNWPEYTNQKRLIVVITALFVIGLALLVILLPASFVYVEYYEMGFVHNRLTGTTDHSQVLQHGCHLFAPQHTLILFPATAQFVDLDLASINSNGLNLEVEVHFQYLLRPSELSTLFKNYDMNYDDVVRNKAETILKTTVTKLSVEELRLNRTFVQNQLFQALRLGLSGDCCKNKVSSRGLEHSQSQAPCNSSANCNQGQHVDITSFQMGALSIPSQVTQNYLRQFTLQIETEREQQIQEGAVIRKQTAAIIKNIENKAQEIRASAKAKSAKIKTISEASRMKMLELSYARALNYSYHTLGITDEDEKISLLYFRMLRDAKDNLYGFTYNYDVNSGYNP